MSSLPKKKASSNTTPENYSVDEMIDHLKKNTHQKKSSSQKDGRELITREDGTQVVKVRRRKRRSKQPTKKINSAPKTNPKLKWALLGILVITLISSVAATIFIIAKYNGRKFKAQTEETITALTGAQSTKLSQLRVTPVSAQALKAELTWNSQSFLKDATFSRIQADIKATSFLSSLWIGEEVVASRGTIHLQTPTASQPTSLELPESSYSFGAYRCNQLSLFFGSEKTSPAITNLMVSLRQLHDEENQMVFQNGTLRLKNWPKLKISSGIATFHPDGVSIEALLRAPNFYDKELIIKGDIANNTEKKATLSVKASNYPIEELLGKDLGRLIKGEILSDSGSLSYDFQKSPEEALSFALPFTSTNIQCEGLPLFKELSKLTGDPAYKRLTFFRARGTLTRTQNEISINNLEFINNSLMVISGNIEVNSKNRLSGTLTIGIPQTVFYDDPPAPFSTLEDGFYNIQVELSGSVRRPNDNFLTLLKAARIQRKKAQTKTRNTISPSLLKSSNKSEKKQNSPVEADFDELMR